ncbi:MAG TPA: Uma2 family endonuclease [Minicystis sp.]|nr:Uma2 family endonuclease [Minicystis sp.]
MLDTSLILPERPRPLRRGEYDQLVRLGAFEGERVELLRGVVVEMTPNDPEHANPVDRLAERLTVAIAGRARVRVQQPLCAADESEPEPDLAVVPLGDYRAEHPREALLVIEVARSSLRKDREVKGPLYAASGFGEYWIVDVADHTVEVRRAPHDETYRTVMRLAEGETLRPEAFPDVTVPVAEIFR